jgi:hypothetical protein
MPVPSVNWKFLLAHSGNLEPIGELARARGKRLSVGINKNESLNLSYRIEDPLSDEISVADKCILCYRNNTLVWSGPIWTIEESLPSNTMNIACVGWFEILNKRFLSADTTYTTTDAGAIASGLLANANAQGATNITMGQIESSQPRTRSYKKYQEIGQEIHALSQIEAGYDYYVTPDTRELNIYYSNIVGNIYGKGQNLPNQILGYNFGKNNVANITRTYDASLLVNKQHVIGASNTTGVVSDTASINTYGIHEGLASLTEVTDTTILSAYAQGEVAVKRTPRVIYRVTPKPQSIMPFSDFDLGDVIYLTAKFGNRFNVENQAIRVYGMTIDIDENGTERITELQTSPS